MRAFICTDYRGKLYRVVWLTESSAGMYLGYYHKRHEVHASYHVDGAFHLTFLGKRLPSPFSEKKLPIDAIKTEQPLMGHSATYTQQGMDMFLPFKRDTRTYTLIVM